MPPPFWTTDTPRATLPAMDGRGLPFEDADSGLAQACRPDLPPSPEEKAITSAKSVRPALARMALRCAACGQAHLLGDLAWRCARCGRVLDPPGFAAARRSSLGHRAGPGPARRFMRPGSVEASRSPRPTPSRRRSSPGSSGGWSCDPPCLRRYLVQASPGRHAQAPHGSMSRQPPGTPAPKPLRRLHGPDRGGPAARSHPRARRRPL